MVTPEPCVVCDGSGDTMDSCGCCWSACHVCIGSGKRPSPWGWAASLGVENSSEAGTGAKDATGGRRSGACVRCGESVAFVQRVIDELRKRRGQPSGKPVKLCTECLLRAIEDETGAPP